MNWNNEWPEPECCPKCKGVISSRRLRKCGRCGAGLESKNQLSEARKSAIRVEFDAISVARLARRAEERRKQEEQSTDLSPMIYFSF